jgi:hypothetical protein
VHAVDGRAYALLGDERGDAGGPVGDVGVLDDLDPLGVDTEAELLAEQAADARGDLDLVDASTPSPPSSSGSTSASETPGTARSAATTSR